jgi:hypothetical protein
VYRVTTPRSDQSLSFSVAECAVRRLKLYGMCSIVLCQSIQLITVV